MKRLFLAVLVAATLGLPVAALATPPDSNPGADCSHGNSGQTCVPDPQPDHGQECEAHGTTNPAGNDGNEDHCLSETTTTTVVTTTPPPTETTTVLPTTTSTPPTTTVAATTTTPPLTSVVTTTTSVPTTTVPPSRTTTTRVTIPSPSVRGPKGPARQGPQDPSRLAFTGVEDIVPIAIIVLVLLTFGTALLYTSRKR